MSNGEKETLIPESVLKGLGGILSFLVGSFALIGLSQGEVSSILRDSVTSSTYVAAFTAAALGCFVLSFALAKVWVNYVVSFGTSIAAFAAISYVKSKTPITGAAGSSTFAVVLLVIGSLLFLIGLVIWIVVKPQHNVWSLQPALLIAGTFLFIAAIYGAVRLESWSQSQSDAQVDAKLTISGKLDTLNLTIHADRVSRDDVVDVVVAAHPRSAPGSKSSSAFTRCGKDDGCVELGEVRMPPDAAGGTKVDRTVAFPLHPSSYDYIYVSADPCQRADDTTAGVQIGVHAFTTPGCHGTSVSVLVDP